MQTLTLDKRDYSLHLGEKSVNLRPREYAVLDVLAHRPGNTWSQEALMDLVWDRAVNLNTVE
ncbi:winged helix-turn-helix domain-containing protein, partial [Curtobacterium sp. MMLR14_002]|uniref:winged helix-turn-helix domain-containing protein n=1 Tax=Curtobacterium sp. MMLR14_002 TaxID=1898741 RepID=UPI001495DEDB